MKGLALLLLSCLASGFLQVKSQVHGKSLIDDQFKDGSRLCYSFLYCGPTESCKFDKPTKECIRFDDEDFVKNIMTSFFKAIIKGNEVLKIFFPSDAFDFKDSSEEIVKPIDYPPSWMKLVPFGPLEEEPTTVETTSQLPKIVSANYPLSKVHYPLSKDYYPHWNPYYNKTWQNLNWLSTKYTTATQYRISTTTPSPNQVNEENKLLPDIMPGMNPVTYPPGKMLTPPGRFVTPPGKGMYPPYFTRPSIIPPWEPWYWKPSDLGWNKGKKTIKPPAALYKPATDRPVDIVAAV